VENHVPALTVIVPFPVWIVSQSVSAARNRLWVVAPSMLTDRLRQPMRQQLSSSESGVPHDLTHPWSPWSTSRTVPVVMWCDSGSGMTSFRALCAGVLSDRRRMWFGYHNPILAIPLKALIIALTTVYGSVMKTCYAVEWADAWHSILIHRLVYFVTKKRRQNQPESKSIAGNTSVNVVEEIITDCSPNSAVFDFQSSFAGRIATHQSDICTPIWSYLNTMSIENGRTINSHY